MAYRKRTRPLVKALGWFSIGLGLAELIAPRRMSRLVGTRKQHPVLMRLLGLREIVSGVGILSRRRPTGFLWSRVAGDAMDLALLSTTLMTSPHKHRTKAATAAVAGVTALDVMTSRRLSRLF